ncbi:hypothetical protein DSECCO2_310040 [anaerobic digester metagenome]
MTERELLKYLRNHTAQEAEKDLEQDTHDDLIQILLEDDDVLDDIVRRFFHLEKEPN